MRTITAILLFVLGNIGMVYHAHAASSECVADYGCITEQLNDPSSTRCYAQSDGHDATGRWLCDDGAIVFWVPKLSLRYMLCDSQQLGPQLYAAWF